MSEKKKILYEILGPYIDRNKEFLFACPKCNHHKRKLSVNVDKNMFKCWVCDYRGRSIVRLVKRFGSYTQLQKWRQLSGGVELDRFCDLFSEDGGEDAKSKVPLPPEFRSLTSRRTSATGIQALNYLNSRGVTFEDIVRWKIGYCFEGEYRNRVVIPSFDDDGDTNFFIARSYTGDSYKYKNPRASKNIVFNELYVDWTNDLTLVEGAFDAIVAGNAVPLLGSTLQENSKLVRSIVYNDTPVFVALDPDAAKKERRLIQTLLKYDIELYKIDVSGYEDVGSMPKHIFQERKQNATFINQEDYLLLDLLAAI
jgi:DNA primase